jgi:hypothetical protein
MGYDEGEALASLFVVKRTLCRTFGRIRSEDPAMPAR